MDDSIGGEELRARRRALRLSQTALAAALNVAPNTVARWERGEAQARDANRVRRALDALGGQVSSLEARPPSRARISLPRQLTSFVGRTAEVAEVRRLLTSSRLLTLVGLGGIGKTRLALEYASEADDHFPDGAALVELAPIVDQALVPQVAATALGVQAAVDLTAPQAITEALADEALLVVLDNCEHVVDAAASLANSLLRACPLLRILATSRQPLGVPGEIVWQVGALPFRRASPSSARNAPESTRPCACLWSVPLQERQGSR
jgi:transcriptional regulator with XRE-family HTH domain